MERRAETRPSIFKRIDKKTARKAAAITLALVAASGVGYAGYKIGFDSGHNAGVEEAGNNPVSTLNCEYGRFENEFKYGSRFSIQADELIIVGDVRVDGKPMYDNDANTMSITTSNGPECKSYTVDAMWGAKVIAFGNEADYNRYLIEKVVQTKEITKPLTHDITPKN